MAVFVLKDFQADTRSGVEILPEHTKLRSRKYKEYKHLCSGCPQAPGTPLSFFQKPERQLDPAG